MTDARLFRSWLHSHEEDHDGITVYRPSDYAFPPSRGRRRLELRPDGTAIEHVIGRNDVAVARPTTWQEIAPGRVTVEAETGRRLAVVRVEDDLLEVREEQ
ncbi:MAG: hypothetical protein ACRDP9_24955 [Kribbellaceae bacterium]